MLYEFSEHKYYVFAYFHKAFDGNNLEILYLVGDVGDRNEEFVGIDL
jgi:hypothetical protein